jgi:signal transduction histidine kinase
MRLVLTHYALRIRRNIMSKEFLRRLPLFAELAEADLDRLYKMAKPTPIKRGEVLIQEGDVGESLYVILDGEFEVTKRSGKQDVFLGVRKSGDVIGEMSLVEQAPRTASIRALVDGRVLEVGRPAFLTMLSCSPSAIGITLKTFSSRLSSTQCLLEQNEKMAVLGRMSAELTHELNNPAAAVRRSSDQLRAALSEWERLGVELGRLTFTPDQSEKLSALREEMETHAGTPPALDPLDRSDQEQDVQTWLEDRDIDRAWELAPMLVSFGWEVGELDEVAGHFSEEQVPLVISWLAFGCQAHALLDEVGKAATHISTIVKAVKGYSYLDQAPVQQVDVHKGLEDTLVILKPKLKSGITIKREYAPDLPHIEAYASELNQVWTNIIDNAADAMHGQGEITLRTYAEGDDVVVEITDSGPGIPPDVQAHIFEPFYTTKPQGEGTGLGLHIVYNIIVEKHNGRIEVNSKPGATTFRVTLPVQLARSQA